MINPKNNDENNDITVAGTDLFADSESFLNELTDSELVQVRGGTGGGAGAGTKVGTDGTEVDTEAEVDYPASQLSLLLC